jgi:hypothetical protein
MAKVAWGGISKFRTVVDADVSEKAEEILDVLV